ncbi:helix-turn-helix domain-containing protein [Paenibacillus sp.]|uniref:helix-turn-helix domain-containing protein n=1 Tax=Paenibacillus sp. TaxID=58172 RepID=UPI002D439C3E|nr:helix-turn-helix domain-containing protein [Paenibacillus sp.]HZG84013.1 helix-turn-helix domain-containing protein [Paenibacillus sp.]
MRKARTLWFNSRSVLLTWAISYAAVLLLPTVLSAVVYIQSSKMLVDEIHAANDSLLKQLREMIDKQIEAVDRLNFELSWNPKVRELIDQHKYSIYPEEFLYDLHNATKDLVMYQSAYTGADLFYVYLASRDVVMLPGVYRDADFAYAEHHKSVQFSYEDWMNILRREKFKGFIPMVRTDENGSPVATLAYVNTYAYENGKPTGANVIMIDQPNMLTAIDHFEVFSEGHVLIADADNRVLVSSSNSELPARLPFEELEKSDGIFFWESDGNRYEVFSMESEVSGLKYISMIPSELYWRKAELVRRLTALSIAASLLGGGGLTYFFLRKNYNPVRQLVRAFKDKPVSKEKGANEFHFIQRALDTTLSEMDNMMLQMKRQHYTLRSNFLMRMLTGKLDYELPMEETLATFDMRLLSNDFAVMLFIIEDHDVFLERVQGKTEGEKLRLLHFIVTNVVEELVNRRHRGYMTETGDALACLVTLSETSPESRMDELLHVARSAQQFLKDKYSIYITVSISGIRSGLEQVHHAYQEALYAMEYKLVMGKQEILPYEEIEKYHTRTENDTGYYFPLQHEQQLMNFVKVGDFESGKAVLEEILEMNFSKHPLSVPVARCLMFDLVGALIKSIGELGVGRENLLTQNPRRIEKLSSSETLAEMRDQLMGLLHEACEYAGAKRQHNIQAARLQALDGFIRGVIAYIDEHYTDPGLNVSVLGHRFDMKPTYLSKLFKEQTGDGLLDAINKRRIGHAKRLMTESRVTVNEAAERSGYNDVGTFIRTFKKIEGITPGKYKEIVEDGEYPKP